MDACFAPFICVAAICLLVGGVSVAWRVYMMVYHPEKYQKFREFEKEFEKHTQKNLQRQAGFALKAGVFIAKIFLKRR